MNLSAEAIVEFLQENPAFFEDKPGLLEQIAIPHPHGGRAISLAERQQLAAAREEQAAGIQIARTAAIRRGK